MNRGKARAHANIALIKYWGKKDEKLFLPMSSSLSLTLDSFYTETEVVFDSQLDRDYFYLNDKLQSEFETKKISKFLDLFRIKMDIKYNVLVKSINYVPTAAGLASSASGFAALAAAANVASGLNLCERELSIYARQGSGSATRSIYGGFVEWKEGNSSETSYAVPIDDAKWDVGMVIVIVRKSKKEISSREGMKRTVDTSPFYNAWVKSSRKDLMEIKKAIWDKDLEKLGTIAEANCLRMHATMFGARPPIIYFKPETIEVMEIVRDLRSDGIPCYFTMDAGPNVNIICRLSQSKIIKDRLKEKFEDEQIIISGPGPGISYL